MSPPLLLSALLRQCHDLSKKNYLGVPAQYVEGTYPIELLVEIIGDFPKLFQCNSAFATLL